VNARPPRARLQSLCGTARGLASEQAQSENSRKQRPCRHEAMWACQGEADRLRRLGLKKR
jgi:hypothetical protein